MERRQILALAVLRQKVGLTQMDLALAIGKSQTEISHWEKGDRALPPVKAEAILAVIRAMDRSVTIGLRPADLSRPWEDVLAERVVAKPERVVAKAR